MVIWRASLDTRNFSFEAFGDTEEAARAALHNGFRKHCRVFEVSLREFCLEYGEGVEVSDIDLGACYRDGEKL